MATGSFNWVVFWGITFSNATDEIRYIFGHFCFLIDIIDHVVGIDFKGPSTMGTPGMSHS